MAAHAFTMLKDFTEHDYSLEVIRHALSYTQGGDCIEIEDWKRLFQSCNPKGVAWSLLDKYEKIWERLGRPKTAEEWLKVKYDAPREEKP